MNLVFSEIVSDSRSHLKKIKAILNAHAKVVYVYSLDEQWINYPFKNGQIIYIGEACRKNENTAERFGQHFNKSNTGSNRTLINFLEKGFKIRLRIFELAINEKLKDTEILLHQWHMNEYGSLPMAISAGSKNYMKKNMMKVNYSSLKNILP